MRSFFFGRSSAPLYGVYEAPTDPGAHRAALICQPVAREYYFAHRPCRLLSKMLANAGTHVLRFDYAGTGDSFGEVGPGTAGQWLNDVHDAVDELTAMSGVSKVSVVGLRLGATLAATATRDRQDIESVTLWDPPYLSDPLLNEILSFYPSVGPVDRLLETLRDPYGLSGHKTLVVRVAPDLTDRSDWQWADQVLDRPGPQPWNTQDDFGSVGIPIDAMQEIVTWVTT